jgi:hypothetical protein
MNVKFLKVAPRINLMRAQQGLAPIARGKLAIIFDDEEEAAEFALACDFATQKSVRRDYTRSAAFRDTAYMIFSVLRGKAEEVGARVFPRSKSHDS